ncbi:ABC transporter ATP-binding protein [Pseudarthrobacter oxydans]|uniref:ABC transporter ATP-binding protein n=1 Tax=Pseudarthrobacter oxydans TaxID=1671 RepID=UPI003816526E
MTVDTGFQRPARDHSSGDPVLAVRSLRKVYDTTGRTVEAIRDLTFSVGDGEFACIVGPSGAGKTTLLKCVAGLMRPTSGAVELDGNGYSSPPEGMAVVFQEYGRSLLPWMTVAQNVELPLKAKKIERRQREHIVNESLAAVGLENAKDAHPWQLSGGMQQRAAIARAVAYEPRILIMDEPFAAVDAQTRADLEDLVYSLSHRRGFTVLFVTHDIDEAVYLGAKVLVMTSSPSVILEEVTIDLPPERTQLETRMMPRFLELRHHVYELVQLAKSGPHLKEIS